MSLIGYARVSTQDQHLHLQQDALNLMQQPSSILTNITLFATIALIARYTMNITNTSVTEKSVPSFEARRHFGKLIDDVKAGDKFVIKEHGQPVAAIVPQHDFSRLVWRVAIASAAIRGHGDGRTGNCYPTCNHRNPPAYIPWKTSCSCLSLPSKMFLAHI